MKSRQKMDFVLWETDKILEVVVKRQSHQVRTGLVRFR